MTTPEDMSETTSAAGRKTALWVSVTGLGQAWKFLISVVSTVVLARLLTPADFGLVATVAPILGFVDMLRDAGFSQALVQRQDVTPEQRNGLFWLLVATTTVVAAFVAGISPFVADFFNDKRIIGVMLVSAAGMFVMSLGQQASALLNRSLRFKALAFIESSQVTLSLVVAATIAWLTHSYWALVAGGLAAGAFGAVVACWLTGWRPGRPHFDKTVWEMARFGAAVSFSNIMNFLSRNADNLLISKFSGPTSLGYYDRAYKLMLFPLNQITWPIARVLMPVLSRLQDREQEYASTYYSTITYLMLVLQPLMITATVMSHEVIVTLLGERWAPSAPIFAWLGAAAIHQLVTSSHGWLYLSQSRVKDYAFIGAFGSVTTIAAFLIGLPWGAVGVAAAYCISDFLLRMPLAWLWVGRTGPVRTRPLLRVALPHVLGSFAAAGALLILKMHLTLTGIPCLIVATLAGYGVYVAIVMLFPEKRTLIGSALDLARVKLLQRPKPA